MNKYEPIVLEEDMDYILTNSAWLEIKGFAIRIHSTDEGVAVDIYKNKCEDNGAIASAYAFDSEVKDESN